MSYKISKLPQRGTGAMLRATKQSDPEGYMARKEARARKQARGASNRASRAAAQRGGKA